MLKVKMLGEFQLWNDGKLVRLGKQKQNHAVTIFVLLILKREMGITQEELFDVLYPIKGKQSEMKTLLKYRIYYLRKLLKNAGIDAENCFLFQDGRYCWNPEIKVESDVELFRNYAKQFEEEQDKEKKAEISLKALNLVEGSFMPDFETELWAIEAQNEIKNLYIPMFKKTFAFLMKKKKYEEALELSQKVTDIYPYDEYQIYSIRALMSLNRKKEAQFLYDQTESLYKKELGVGLSPEFKNAYMELSLKICRGGVNEEFYYNVQEYIEEGTPLFVPFLNFTQYSSFMKFLSNRRKEFKSCILSCFIEGNRVESIAKVLEKTIEESLRKSDIYTKYDASTYMILLSGTDQKNSAVVQKRLMERFNQNITLKRVKITYHVIEL